MPQSLASSVNMYLGLDEKSANVIVRGFDVIGVTSSDVFFTSSVCHLSRDNS